MAKLTPLKISGAWIIESEVHDDNRGNFREWFRAEDLLRSTGIQFNPVQANLSTSSKGVIRGIHFSKAREGQSKLITCAYGRILDVIVDIRPDSDTFKSWEAVELSQDSGLSIFLSHGLGHAFQSLSDHASVAYLLSSEYSPSNEFAINPLDSELSIDWPVTPIILSHKDREARGLKSVL